MDHFVEQIDIKNFKSIRNLTLTGFKRINLFIGRPNVGKSNLLEAISLFSLPFIWNGSKNLTDIIRLQYPHELFYEASFDEEDIFIQIKRADENWNLCQVSFGRSDEYISIIYERKFIEYINKKRQKENSNIHEEYHYDVNTRLKLIDFDQNFSEWNGVDTNFMNNNYHIFENSENFKYDYIRPYYYKKDVKSKKSNMSFLTPPFGGNLVYALEWLPDLRKIFAKWFRQYELRLVLDTTTQTLKIQRDKGDEVFQLPYSSVADTLQRIIFYKTAIASNKNSVLLFEEPEAHAYTPYISEFTQEIIGSKTNQTFIVTHSPLIVNDMLDNVIDELAIFIVDFKDGQTVARALTQEELYEVRKFGVDLFFNGEAYPV